MMKSSNLIVLEGIDGVGKTTFAQMLTSALLKSGVEAIYLSFPGREPGYLSKHIYELHHTPKNYGIASLHPASLQILHVAAHVEAIECRIKPALAKGCLVILDRFWWSTVAYGRAAGVDEIALWKLVEVENQFWSGITPTLLFYLERPELPLTQASSALKFYRDLIAHKTTKFEVHSIKNDGTIGGAFETILQTVKRKLQKLPVPNLKEPQPSAWEKTPTIFSKLSPAKPTIVYDTYWRFAVERQNIFFRRFHGEPPPWTRDPILQEHKFTNAYRASDRVSQYLIKHVIYTGDQRPSEAGFRILLFKLFNKIETWELLRNKLGELRADDFKLEHYDSVLSAASAAGKTLYSGAYIMPSGGAGNPGCKHKMHLNLVSKLIKDDAFDRIAGFRTMRQGFEFLRSYPSFGDFLAYQYITDINYSTATDFSEMEFVIPGPGARDGLRKSFSDCGGLSESDMIRLVADKQAEEFKRLGLSFQSLWGRPLQLIDCQNLFCEVDKYSRVKHPEIVGLTGRTRIKQKFSHRPLGRLPYWYPPKWKINEQIKGEPYVFDL